MRRTTPAEPARAWPRHTAPKQVQQSLEPSTGRYPVHRSRHDNIMPATNRPVAETAFGFFPVSPTIAPCFKSAPSPLRRVAAVRRELPCRKIQAADLIGTPLQRTRRDRRPAIKKAPRIAMLGARRCRGRRCQCPPALTVLPANGTEQARASIAGQRQNAAWLSTASPGA